ncbi:FxDxF family PEP-CTERM protein [Methylobacillus methanolivorans]|uniref:FxDxF family PEP-CTERM protein n=1 Tax=Methylobacillus methanolivorans TaxID=1848927 RepID=A0ABW8GHR5_9PROT
MLVTTFKKGAVALAFGLTSLAATSAFAAPIVLPVTDGTVHFGNDFSAEGSFTDVFQFTLTDFTDVSGTASSTYLTLGNVSVFQGVDLTSVVLASSDAVHTYLTQSFAGGSVTTETYTFSLAGLSAGTYNLTISGVAGLTSNELAQASYGGNITFTAAVPEPSTYGMLALGLGLVGFAARGRKNASKFA